MTKGYNEKLVKLATEIRDDPRTKELLLQQGNTFYMTKIIYLLGYILALEENYE